MGTRLTERGPIPKSHHLACGYLRMAEPDEDEISRLRLGLGKYCQQQGYHLVTVYCDQDVRDTELTRPGFRGLVDAISAAYAEQVIVLVPSRAHLSDHDLFRERLERSIRLTGAKLVVTGEVNGQSPEGGRPC